MPRATDNRGRLIFLDCQIFIPGAGTIRLDNLPEITDSKSAAYNDEPIIGRANPLKTYSHSENRTITMQIHLFATEESDLQENLTILRALQSAVYPRTGVNGAPFIPPPVCQIKCGTLLADDPLCVILKQYSMKPPTDVAWSEDGLIPYKFDIDTTWEVVYKNSDLPGQSRIFNSGR